MLDRILIVTDSLDEISSGLNELLARKPDFIIVIGGLGPTPDDMTLKGVALALGNEGEAGCDGAEADEGALCKLRKDVRDDACAEEDGDASEGFRPRSSTRRVPPRG